MILSKDIRDRVASRVGRKRDRSTYRSESIAPDNAHLALSRSKSHSVHPSVSKRAKTVGATHTSKSRDRSVMGFNGDADKLAKVEKMKKKIQRANNLLAKAGEADRTILTRMPKHLFAGKRGFEANHR